VSFKKVRLKIKNVTGESWGRPESPWGVQGGTARRGDVLKTIRCRWDAREIGGVEIRTNVPSKRG